ncbi:NAD-dependent epimerase/dehydratase family protein [Streptomyces sp. NPDC002928]|uniref:NAD-dependent epimerase/dehydratase family protein n=1 Tax=Streptomyces sp. NPDC002928 TaxID=3154440 RepID=UPI0033AEB94C
MHILLTGATGFVGQRLARHLIRQGHTVTALVRAVSSPPALQRLRSLGVSCTVTELQESRTLSCALKEADAVMHLAAVTRAADARDYHRVNAGGTRAVLRTAAALGTPPTVVFCSSIAAAGPSTPGRPRTETDAPAPVSHYGRSKLAAEAVVRGHADRVPATIVRPPVVYGPGDPGLFPTLAGMVRAGVGVRPAPSGAHYCLVHVDDLCAALLTALTAGRRLGPEEPGAGMYQVCDGTPRSWQEICRSAARALDRKPPLLLSLPRTAVMAAAAVAEAAARSRGGQALLNRDKARELVQASWTCTSDQARAELGFVPVRTALDREFRAALADP